MERVRLNGADIEYQVRGSGAPVVLIHGAILSDGFVPVMEQTGIAENFQIVHYRRRGYAGSSPAVAGMTMQGWAGDCIALLNHLGIASAHVAGHSFGAGIALQMAIDAPGRVRRLALLEPPLLSLVPSGGQFSEWMASVREIYDSGDKTAATDIVLAGAYGRDYRRFTDVALPAGAFDRAVSDIDTYFQVELGAMQQWNITTESLKDIRHPVLSMRGSDTSPCSLRAPIYCSSGLKKSTPCRYRAPATTCRAGIPLPSPMVSPSSSPEMTWIFHMSNKLRFDEYRPAGDMAVSGLAELARFARFADGDHTRRLTEFQDLRSGPALARGVTVVGGLGPALRGAAMHERDLIVGVLAVQAGFVSPSQVLTSAAAGLVDAAPDSLLTRLERTGVLSPQRRNVLEALVEQALRARNDDRQAPATSMGGPPARIETQVSAPGGPLTSGDDPAVPEIPLERPGQYTRMQELGRGSQSVVRVARDELVGREVALKELVTPPGTSGHASPRAARARFLREVRLVASLDHPGIVSILDLARREDDTLFCAQKLVRGETLQARLVRCRSLGDRLALLRHLLDACEAMAFAHSKNIIHRDLKPANMMIGEGGETVIIDWGLAKRRDEADELVPPPEPSTEAWVSTGGSAVGTPAYMSPEQARGDLQAVGAPSDVFSLGAILYQVLTGRPPFEGATSDHILESVMAGEFHPARMLTPDAPPELAAIAERALQPQPSERYRDATELARDLRAYLTGGRVRAYRYGALELVKKVADRHRALMVALAVALASFLGSAIIVEFGNQARAAREGAAPPHAASSRFPSSP